MIFGIFDSRKFELDGLARKFRRLCTRALATLREETGLRLAGMEWEGRRCAPFVYRHPARPIHLTAKYGLSRAYRGLEFSSKSLGTKLEIPSSSSSSSARLVRSCLKYFRLFSYNFFSISLDGNFIVREIAGNVQVNRVAKSNVGGIRYVAHNCGRSIPAPRVFEPKKRPDNRARLLFGLRFPPPVRTLDTRFYS